MKKRNKFPTAYTILFAVLVLVTIFTYIVPSGAYSKLYYNSDIQKFEVTSQSGHKELFDSTQETLEKLNIKINIDKFTSGSIKKTMAIPNTYIKTKKNPIGFVEFIKAPILGIVDTINITVFILILGGMISVINKTGTFNIAMRNISTKAKGKEFLFVILTFLLVVIGGTTFGFWEETIPFYTILAPLFLVNSFDIMVCMATIFLASAVGCMFSTVNPFSIIIASDIAGIPFTEGISFRFTALVCASIISLIYIYIYIRKIKKNPEKSLTYNIRNEIKNKFLKEYDEKETFHFSIRKKIILFLFVFQFVVMVYGISHLGWSFEEISVLFLGLSIIIMFISGLSENDAVNSFVSGASDVIGVTLIIGLARAINIIMEVGMMSDTLIFYSTEIISNMNKGLFAFLLLFIFIFLGLFIPSTSGLAVLSMPILAPLADTAGLPRSIVVDAYTWGQGLVLFLTPTGLIFIVLEITGIPYNKWLKFALPLVGILMIFTLIMLYIRTLIL